MPNHICPRCNYTTDRRSSFRIHINRKDTCTALIEDVSLEDIRLIYNNTTSEKIVHICEYCNKHFTSKHNLGYHLRVCKHKPSLQEVQKAQTDALLVEKDKQIADLMAQVSRLSGNVGITTNITNTDNSTNNNITNNNTVHIHINNFGSENKDYITEEFVMKCLDKEVLGIACMMKEIYFNDDHEENHNVRLVSLKNSLVEVFQNHDWVPMGLFDTIHTMLGNSTAQILFEAEKIVAKSKYSEATLPFNTLDPETKRRLKERAKAMIVDRRNKTSKATEAS